MITVIYAHPYPLRSRGGRPLLDAVRDAAGRRGALALRPLSRLRDRRRRRAARARGAPARGLAAPALLVQRAGAAEALVRARCSRTAGRTARAAPRCAASDCLWVATTGGAELVLAGGACTRTRSTSFVPPVRADRALLRHALAGAARRARRAPRRSGRAARRRHAATASGSNATSPRRAVPRARPRDERVPSSPTR